MICKVRTRDLELIVLTILMSLVLPSHLYSFQVSNNWAEPELLTTSTLIQPLVSGRVSHQP